MPDITSMLDLLLCIIPESPHRKINTCKEMVRNSGCHVEALAAGEGSKGNSREVSDSSGQTSSFSTCLNRSL